MWRCRVGEGGGGGGRGEKGGEACISGGEHLAELRGLKAAAWTHPAGKPVFPWPLHQLGWDIDRVCYEAPLD